MIANVFIGWDQREEDAYTVCVRSLLEHASKDVKINKITIVKT